MKIKKIAILIGSIFFWMAANSQNNSWEGNANTITNFASSSAPTAFGLIKANLVNAGLFSDTTSANAVNYIKNYTGSYITTYSGGVKLWIRYNGSWNQVGSGSSSWGITGNAGTTAGTNFLGTTDNVDLVFKRNSIEAMRVHTNGNVGIGTSSPSQKLEVNGGNALFTADNVNVTITATEASGTSSLILRSSGQQVLSINGSYSSGLALSNITIPTGGVFRINGLPSSVSSADSILVSTSTNQLKKLPQSAIASQNIYNTDGSLTGNREVDLDGNNLYFTNGGNVGIGTSSPLVPFDTYGSVVMGRDSNDYLGGLFKIDQPNGRVYVGDYAGGVNSTYIDINEDAEEFDIYNGGSKLLHGTALITQLYCGDSIGLTVLRNGKVGMGTINPPSRLTVQGTIRNTDSLIATGILSNVGTKALRYNPATGNITYADTTIGNSGTVTSVATGLGLSGGTITTSGTLLVDTASASILSRQRAASTYLQLAGGTLTGGLIGTTSTMATSYTSPLLIGGTGTTSTLTLKTTTGVGTTNSDMIFQVGNNGATEAMRIKHDGKVGIGTTTPAVKFHVVGSNNSELLMDDNIGYLTYVSGAGDSLLKISPATNTYSFGDINGNRGNGTNVKINDKADGEIYFNCINPVKVGINNTSPTVALDITGAQLVSGAVQFSNYGAGAATFDASGNISSVSDIRLKDVQGNYAGGLTELMQITPIIYKWNKKSHMETEHNYIGFSAQNIKESLGDGAYGINKEGYLSIQDRAIMATLVNAIKEQQQQIEQLKREVKKLTH